MRQSERHTIPALARGGGHRRTRSPSKGQQLRPSRRQQGRRPGPAPRRSCCPSRSTCLQTPKPVQQHDEMAFIGVRFWAREPRQATTAEVSHFNVHMARDAPQRLSLYASLVENLRFKWWRCGTRKRRVAMVCELPSSGGVHISLESPKVGRQITQLAASSDSSTSRKWHRWTTHRQTNARFTSVGHKQQGQLAVLAQ